MALALHRLTGLPLIKIVGEHHADGKWCQEPAHVAVKLMNTRHGPRWIDVDGVQDGIPRHRLQFIREPERISIRPSSVKEITFLYTKSGVTEQEVQIAIRDAGRDPKLRQILQMVA